MSIGEFAVLLCQKHCPFQHIFLKVGVTSSVCYFAFSRLLMAAVCFAGTLLQTKDLEARAWG